VSLFDEPEPELVRSRGRPKKSTQKASNKATKRGAICVNSPERRSNRLKK